MDQRMEKLLRAAKDTACYAAGKAAEAAAATGQAVSAAGEKVSDYRDLHRLEREIQSLRQEVKLQLQAVGGMISATLLAIFFVPLFFVLVRRRFPGKAHPAATPPAEE